MTIQEMKNKMARGTAAQNILLLIQPFLPSLSASAGTELQAVLLTAIQDGTAAQRKFEREF